ncbi:ATP-binding cassette domain-containing protein [Streptomyces apocyni]|uniref:ATP-binding cassette domain-containing protein n=1 Tax=Streptomyces apocyni TaxID=2654677 RepID=UPI0012EAB60D|nr:ATP-binding cassette domain-containing protein [Streptomyces apocyni]
MIQAIGLTSNARRDQPPAADDVSFEAPPGRVTALLGAADSGTATVLRLMLELQAGRGVTYFRGRPLHRIARPSREVGVLVGDVPGHPGRTVRGHLRMLCAATGVPLSRADDVLESVGLVSLRDQRLGTLSRGMDRRLGLACAVLADPHTLVLDKPSDGLCARESAWLHGALRAHADQGGTVLFSTADPREAARGADRVVTLDQGKVVADQEADAFARTRLRPRVAVRSPYAARLGALLAKEARVTQRSVEIVREDGNRLSVYGSHCADVGETAFRHGVLIHQLADEVGDCGPPPPPEPSERAAAATPKPEAAAQGARRREARGRGSQAPLSPLPPPITVRPARTPLNPLRYEVRRATGVSTGWLVTLLVLTVSTLMAVALARAGHTPQPRLLAAWPHELPLPPAAMGAGLLGALAFGDEFRHPALAVYRAAVPRRLGLLLAKLAVSAATGLLIALATVVCAGGALHLVYGSELSRVPADWPLLTVSWLALVVGCAWAGLLAAGVFRSTAAGLAALLAVPVVLVPLVQKAFEGPSARSAAGLPGRLRDLALSQWPFGSERYIAGALRVIAQPVGGALLLSLTVLLCAYLLTTLRTRLR